MKKIIFLSAVGILVVVGIVVVLRRGDAPIASPTPTPTPTESVSPVASPTPSKTPKISVIPSASPTPTPGIIFRESKIFYASIKIRTFVPETITLIAGDVVVFTNDDTGPHTVTLAGKFDSGAINPGDTWMLTTANWPKGTYEYLCSIHPATHGTIIVQ